MDLLQAVILGLVQGATEFIPVSSSGHLVLIPWLMSWPEPGLTFDTTVHLGTLAAVLAYFWKDLLDLVRAAIVGLLHRDPWGTPKSLLAWLIVAGTIPAASLGFLFEEVFEKFFGAPVTVAALLLVTGLLLILGEKLGKQTRELGDLRWGDALLIGLAQAVAILPGVSRSGATITAGLGLSVRRDDSARFSFLLSVPIIMGTGLFQLLKTAKTTGIVSQAPEMIVGFVTAAVCGYLCIHFLLRYLQKHSLYVFSAYCWAFGLTCLLVAYLRG